MAHHYTWDKLAKNAYRLNPKSRGPKYPYVPRWEVIDFTSGQNKGKPVIVPYKGTHSLLISLRAWGVTQSSLHSVTLMFHNVDIVTENPMNTNYFQVQHDGTTYWVHKLDKYRNPLTSRCSCFTGDTEVLLADGTYQPIRNLVGQEGFDIVAYDEQTDRFEKVKAFNCELKGTNQQLVKVTLDDGQEIKCTPDHRFLLKDGSWVEAQNLKFDDSLRALYFNNKQDKLKRLLPDGGTQTISDHKGNEDYYVYVYLDPRCPGEYKYQSCEFPFKPIYIGKGRRNRHMTHWNQPIHNNPFHNTLKSLKLKGLEPIILKQDVNLTEHVAYKLEAQLTHEIGLACDNQGPLLNLKHGGEGGLSGVAKLYVTDSMLNDNPMKDNFIDYKAIKDRQKAFLNNNYINHKVKSVEFIGTDDVYCLTAEYFGNFVTRCKDGSHGVKSGIVVENCKDSFFTWAYYQHRAGCLYGPAPRPYKRKTTWMPPRNPSGIVGMCKHVYHSWELLKSSGMTLN